MQSIGQVGFPGQNADHRVEWSLLQTFPLGIRNSFYQWQLELETEGLWEPGPEAEEDRLPGGLTHHSLTGSQRLGLPCSTQVQPDKAAGSASRAEERMVSRNGVMPGSRARQRASRPAPAVCQLLAEPEDHGSRQEAWWLPSSSPAALG